MRERDEKVMAAVYPRRAEGDRALSAAGSGSLSKAKPAPAVRARRPTRSGKKSHARHAIQKLDARRLLMASPGQSRRDRHGQGSAHGRHHHTHHRSCHRPGTEQAAHTAAAAKDQAANVAASRQGPGSERRVDGRRGGQGRRVRGGRRRRRTSSPMPASSCARRPTSSRRRSRRWSATSAASSARWPTPATPDVAKDIIATFADQAEQMSQRLSDGGLDRTLEDARRLARNRPGLFLAGAALAGFVAARVARAADTDSLKQAASPPADGSRGQRPRARVRSGTCHERRRHGPRRRRGGHSRRIAPVARPTRCPAIEAPR